MTESKKTPKKRHPINNKEFLEEIRKFYALREKDPDCQIPNSLGEIVVKLCTNLGYHRNFLNYTHNWKTEMISDAIFHCVQGLHRQNFSLDNDNPHAYFTRAAWNAFIARIKSEKKQQYIEKKIESMNPRSGESDRDITSDSIINDFEESLERKKRENSTSG